MIVKSILNVFPVNINIVNNISYLLNGTTSIEWVPKC